jgi:hypothetical protein
MEMKQKITSEEYQALPGELKKAYKSLGDYYDSYGLDFADCNLTELGKVMSELKQKEAKECPEIHGNPWREKTWNLTSQCLIFKHDPVRAARLKREAIEG